MIRHTRTAMRAVEVVLWLAVAGLVWLVLSRVTGTVADRAGRLAGIR